MPFSYAQTVPSEPLWFYVTNSWYKGKYPNFHDVTKLPAAKILEANYEVIKKEVLEFYEREGDTTMQANFTPYKYKEEGWRTVNLMSFMLMYPKLIKKFPATWEILNAIPGMVSVTLAVLKPHTRIKAHFGDSNAIVRTHLGLVVPGKYPELGLRNGSREQCWEEGKTFAITIAHRHYAWNNTDHKRIILMVDTVHDDFKDRKMWICALLLSSATMKFIATKIPVLKKTPDLIPKFFHPVIGGLFYALLFVQHKVRFDFDWFFRRFK
jgi:aspartyl/asparaginyl beta-hydroxylase (cupin superfamily)